MTPEEIAFAEAALEYAEELGQDAILTEREFEALVTAARYGVTVANNYRNRKPRLIPRVWRGWS